MMCGAAKKSRARERHSSTRRGGARSLSQPSLLARPLPPRLGAPPAHLLSLPLPLLPFPGPPKDAAELAADDADLPLWEEEWEDEDACDFAARLKRELAARVA